MNLIVQPSGSFLCGQACVAMVLGITLEQSIHLFGHKHGSKTKDLIRALRSRYVFTGDRLKVFSRRNPWPQRCIIREIYRLPGRKKGSVRILGHFVLLWNGKIYDPDPHDGKGKYSSFLEIRIT